MRNLQELSGPWVGFWVQGSLRGSMRLNLRFSEGSLVGDGADLVGSFVISGQHDTAGVVGFVKTYPSHHVDYSGTWDGSMIAGTWRIGRRRVFDAGEFEIWPERDHEAIERMEAALAATG